MESEQAILQRLREAMHRREGVIIAYRAAGAERDHDFLLFPKSVFQRVPYTYASGWSAHRPRRTRMYRRQGVRSGQHREFRLHRILSVKDSRHPPTTSILQTRYDAGVCAMRLWACAWTCSRSLRGLLSRRQLS